MSALVTARGVTFELPDGRELFQNLSLSLEPGVTALVGPNGVGKTSLARLLAGELTPSAGVIQRVRPIRFFPQRELPGPGLVQDYLSADDRWSHLSEQLVAGLPRDALCAELSGGEWMR